jgi:hypothetical protein
VNGVNAVGFPDKKNNLFFNLDDLEGTPAEILAQINNPVNWTRADELQTWPNYTVVITSSVRQMGTSFFNLNPRLSEDFLVAENGSSLPLRLSILNMSGKTEILQDLPSGKTNVSVNHLPSGIYLARTIGADGRVETIRFQVVK